MIDRTLAAIAANRATFLGTVGVALAAALLSAGPSRADVITLTETGFTGSKGNEDLTGGTLIATFTATPEKDGTYQFKDVTKASATYTVGTTVYRAFDLSGLGTFQYDLGSEFLFTFNIFDESEAIEGFVQTKANVIEGIIDDNAATSSSPYTVSIVPGGSSNLGSPSAVPEPSTWALFGLGVVAMALARRGRKDRLAVL